MEILKFDSRSQMTATADTLSDTFGYEKIRCRIDCCLNMRRNAILLLNGNIVAYKLIRCKTYKNGGCNGNNK